MASTFKLFSIYDKAEGKYLSVTKLTNESVAIREYSNAFDSKEPNMINTNPEDKELWLLGQVDDTTGEIIVEKRLIMKFIDLAIDKGKVKDVKVENKH